jgi:hypothetical protein
MLSSRVFGGGKTRTLDADLLILIQCREDLFGEFKEQKKTEKYKYPKATASRSCMFLAELLTAVFPLSQCSTVPCEVST